MDSEGQFLKYFLRLEDYWVYNSWGWQLLFWERVTSPGKTARIASNLTSAKIILHIIMIYKWT